MTVSGPALHRRATYRSQNCHQEQPMKQYQQFTLGFRTKSPSKRHTQKTHQAYQCNTQPGCAGIQLYGCWNDGCSQPGCQLAGRYFTVVQVSIFPSPISDMAYAAPLPDIASVLTGVHGASGMHRPLPDPHLLPHSKGCRTDAGIR